MNAAEPTNAYFGYTSGQGRFTLDKDNNLILTEAHHEGSRYALYVNRWNGNAWVQLGTVLNPKAESNSYVFAVKVDSSNNPVVAFTQNTNTNQTQYDAYVKRWNGTSWVTLGKALEFALANPADSISLDIDSAGNPVVAWSEEVLGRGVYVKRWLGDRWQVLSSSLKTAPTNDIADPALVIPLNTARPIVAWQEFNASNPGDVYVKEFKSGAWTSFGAALDVNPANKAFSPALAYLSLNSRPVVAFLETDSSNVTKVYGRRWNGTSWVSYGGALNTGTTTSAFELSLALKNDDKPVITWSESSATNVNNRNIYVKRWTGAQWLAIGTALDVSVGRNARSPSLIVNFSDNPVVAWSEFGGTGQSYNIYVKEWDGTTWVPLGGALDVTLSANAQTPALIRGSDGNPIVAWSEGGDIRVKRWNSMTLAWVNMGSVIDIVATNAATEPTLALRSTFDGNPVIAWRETNNIYVKRWTGTKWVAIGGVVDVTQSNIAQAPSLFINYDDPFVALLEQTGTVKDLVVREYCCTF